VIVSIDAGVGENRNEPSVPSTGASPAEQAAVREQKRRLAEALDTLTPRAAMIFTLFYQEEMSIAEIAPVVGMKPGAVKVALHRAREVLRERLGESKP
jgi:RNA polymerase sigma-70 factor (ECF subfamily)